MNCIVCGAEVGEKKKYAMFMIKDRQVTICKGCLTKGNLSKPRSIITERGVIKKPILVFGSDEADLREIAKEEGWEVTKSVRMETELGTWFITKHWGMAQKFYWFRPDGSWGRLEYKSGVERDCFRRSCRNIRDYFGVWLDFCR